MRRLRYYLTFITLLGFDTAPAKAQNNSRYAKCLTQVAANDSGNRIRYPDGRGLNQCVQVRKGFERAKQTHRACPARRSGEAPAPVRRRSAPTISISGAIIKTDSRSTVKSDLDGDHELDECRWLNAGGMRIAKIEKNKIKSWKQISAEEASKVLVQALVIGDLALLDTVMATPEELAAAGVPKDIVARVAESASKRSEQVTELRKKLIGWTEQTVWNRFDGTFPHVIPADPTSGLEKDLILYENAMVIPGTSVAQQNLAKMAFLQIPDMIELGATWKFVELPRAIDPEKPIVTAASGIRAMLFDRANNIEQRDEAVDAALESPCRLRHQECAVAPGRTEEGHGAVQRGPRAALARDCQGVEKS